MKKHDALRSAEKYTKAHQRKRRWYGIVTVLACVVVFCTTYALILPAITLENQCDIPEHTHTDACYTQVTSAEETAGTEPLTCTNTEADHVHTDRCYGTWELTCGMEEHTHTDECQAAEDDCLPVEDCLSVEGSLSEETAGTKLKAALPGDHVDGGAIDGTDITWELTQNDLGEYTLTFEGNGAIPDYTSAPDGLWRTYTNTDLKLVFGDGITRVGNYAFKNMALTDVEWGGVTSIGQSAFSYIYLKPQLTIPGTIKEIDSGAFNYARLSSVVIEDGVQTIGADAFGGANGRYEVSIPASVTQIGSRAFISATAYRVAEDNPNYCSIDGVLYSKDRTVLVDYPKYMDADEYRVPAFVNTIANAALQYVKLTQKVYIPATVQTLPSQLFRNSDYEEIYIEDGITLNDVGLILYFDSALQTIHWPENAQYQLNGIFYDGIYPNLTSFKFPNGITRIGSFGWQEDKVSFPSLETVIYDSADAQITSTNIMGSTTRFDLTVGPSVDHLPANFSYFASHAINTYFAPNNTFTAEEGAFAGAGKPLSGLSGNLYVDSQGLLYTYDAENNTASFVYCPPGISQATIPATITPEEGVVCSVTGVGADALYCAENLTGLTFDAPETIKSLGTHALANCPTLVSVNDKTTVEEAEALFTGAEKGYRVFYNTGLTGAGGAGSFEADMSGKKSLTVSSAKADAMRLTVKSGSNTMEWISKEGNAESGGYRLLTGDTVTVEAAINDPQNTGCAYRVYYQLTNDEGTLSITPGQTYDFNGQAATCYATEDPDTVYLEFTPTVGSTVSIPVTAVYPSPGSSGGGLTVWGVILPADKTAETTGKLVDSQSGVIQAYWTTVADTFQLAKTSTGKADLQVVSDGNGNVIPNDSMNWKIELTRENETTSAYGKDYAKSADFTDVLTLPAGVSWNDDVKRAIIEGTVRKNGNGLYAGGVKLFDLSLYGSGLSMAGVRVTWDDDQNTAVVHWRVVSSKQDAEMSAATVNLVCYPECFSLDMTTFSRSEKNSITNTANAVIHYHYRSDADLTASAAKTISGGSGSIKLKKTATDAAYFGENITYTLDLYNDGGLEWTGDSGAYELRDTLSPYSYISIDNMRRMFEDAYGDDLTITITKVVLAPWEQVTGTDGTAAWRTSANSDLGGDTTHTLTVTKGSGGYTVTVDGNTSYTESSLATALQEAGYAATGGAEYQCVWKLNSDGETMSLQSGEHRLMYVYATAKDTFRMLTKDWPNYYANEDKVSLVNAAKVFFDNTQKISVSVNNQVKREAEIYKSVYRDGQMLTSAPSASDGDVLTYHLDFLHYGSGEYTDLPMVDDLYGSQYLLVPVSLNESLTDKGLEIYTALDGTAFYKLKEGTYTNVSVGTDDEGKNLIAASITVSAPAENDGSEEEYTGLHTQIKWYFPHLNSGNYQMTVTYQTIMDMSLSGLRYTIGNKVWMNDRTDRRIYAALWGGGPLIEFGKEIVTERGETSHQDKLAEDRYSLVSPGETVTYRLELRNVGNGTITLSGSDIADALPETYQVFPWEKGVNVQYLGCETVGTVETTGLDQWNLGTNYAGTASDRQYILWPNDARITFHDVSTVYLYFSLIYPQDSEAGETWSQYAAINQGGMIDNTLYVYAFPSNVVHELRETGQALLQKGVYGMYYYQNGYNTYTEAGSSRLYYNNRDSRYRAVAYYVTLYNGGNKRLYLSDLYDKLPAGFTYRHLIMNGYLSNQNSIITTTGGLSLGEKPLTEMGTEVVYRSAQIKATQTDSGVTFSISAGTGDYALKYDEEREQYYLDRGEAIVFGYLADIGTAAQTGDNAVNTIAMAYTDHLGTGLNVVDKSTFPVTAPDSEQFTDYNDGSRQIRNGQQVQEEYGFGDGSDQIWMVSDVTLTRGKIIPGVTKYTDSYTSGGSTPVAYTNSVGPTDTVNWRVRLHNSGTLSVTDYTFTDIMPEPYVFTGTLKRTLYDSNGNLILEETVLTFPERAGTETEITVKNTNGTSCTVPFDGTEVNLQTGINISLSRDTSGNEVLKIRFEDPTFSIPEGGYVDIELSSRNPTNSFQYTVYTNQAMLTPNAQEFTTVQQGSMVRDESGKPVSAKNSAPVTVSSGYATSSVKQVAEADDSSNTAASTDPANNTIILSDTDSEFVYTLTVTNATENAMTKLVLIDNLPKVGDHSPFDANAERGSEFEVVLAENPAFQVTVKKADGESSTLDSSYYKVQYSTSADFGEPQSADWKGEDTGTTAGWTDDPTGARSIRVIIQDGTATQIPEGAAVSLTFHAKVNGTPEPGQIAWNSFGYHYGLQGVHYELEAMPLAVGVQIPTVPSIQKKLVDLAGTSYTAENDATFNFLVYEGAPLAGEFDTVEKLEQALDAANRSHQQFAVTVEAGNSVSEQTYLNGNEITWAKGRQYTVVELPESEEYAFRSFAGSGTETYTFTYDPAVKEVIVCENTYLKWSVSVTKQDAGEHSLSGAVFALYSPDSTDQIGNIPAEYSDLSIASTLERDGQTWYLAGIQTSDEKGELGWSGLLRDRYVLLEVKAPDGYKLDHPDGYMLYRDESKNGVYPCNVINYTDYELPNAGGMGTTLFYVFGSVLVLAAVVLLVTRKRMRVEG